MLLARLRRSLRTWPDVKGWGQCGLIAAVAVALIAVVAGLKGWLMFAPHLSGALPRLLSVMAVPAFAEEVVFRGLLIPERGETRRPVIWIAAGVLLFVLWHVLEALTFLPGARLFLTPEFLVCAAILGAACAMMRYRTGSVWPGVLLHGGVVWLWQACFNGPNVMQLLAS